MQGPWPRMGVAVVAACCRRGKGGTVRRDIQVKVICHPVTGRSKGYGFVKFSSKSEAAMAAFEKMSDEVLDGKNIRVHYANSGQYAHVSAAVLLLGSCCYRCVRHLFGICNVRCTHGALNMYSLYLQRDLWFANT